MKEAYTTKDLCEVMGTAPKVMLSRAKREAWPSLPRSGRGGGKEFPFATLPDDVRIAIIQAEEAKLVPASNDLLIRPTLATASVSDTKKTKAMAKVDLVALYQDWVDGYGHGGKGAARKEFISAYKGGAWPKLLDILGMKVSWQSIERWKVSLRRTGTAVALVDNRGIESTGRTMMDQEHIDILLNAVLHPNAKTLEAAFRRASDAMVARGLDRPSPTTMRRFVKKWKETNFGTWVYTREGRKAWVDKCAFFVSRDYSRINVGDILVADGHVLNFETINPATGKPKRMELIMWYDMASNCPVGWEIMPTENTEAIAAAFRRSIITLGKYPLIAYLDNGRAFRSKYFNGVDFKQTGIGGLFGEMGINTIFAWPYHGQSKTVERFFGTMAELEEMVPSFVGRGIEHKPPRLNRGEPLHRAAYEASGGRPLTLEETYVAVSWWVDKYINTPQHRSHLKGKCPAEAFMAGRGDGVDRDKLRHLMLSKKIAKIYRDGIHHDGGNYWAEELQNRNHKALIRYDSQQNDTVLVYTEDGDHLICEAMRMGAVHPAASLLGTPDEKKELERQLEIKGRQEKDASALVRGVLEDALADNARRMEQVLPEEKKPIEENVVIPISRAKEQRIAKAIDTARKERESRPLYTPPEEKISIVSEMDKYEYLFKIKYKERLPMREEDTSWMAYYEVTGEYREAEDRYLKLRKLYARWAKEQ